jgi:hypothetical protein
MTTTIAYQLPHLGRVVVEAPTGGERAQAVTGAKGAALFFSGGVDSFYSLLKRDDEITHLVYVHGFDTLLSSAAIRAHYAQSLRQAANEAGKQFFEIETNMRVVLDPIERWGHQRATSAQVAIVQALAPQFATSYVAENYPYNGEMPLDSLPYVRAADGVSTVFDGLDTMRIDKIAFLAQSPLAMKWLRVCWQNLGLAFNCGRCEKCLRTMIALDLAGALQSCRTFREPIDIERVRYTDWSNNARFWPELVLAAQRSGDRQDLVAAMRDAAHASTTLTFRWYRVVAHLERMGGMSDLAAIVRDFAAMSEAPEAERAPLIKLREAMARNLDLERELRIIKSSASWKLTAPLRDAGQTLRRLRWGTH